MHAEVINPATEDIITTVDMLDEARTEQAIRRASAAMDTWRAISAADRARLLQRFALAVEADMESLAQLETRNCGHTLANSRFTLRKIVDCMLYFGGAAERLIGKQIPVDGGISMTFHEPVGIVAVIAPWNFPLMIAVWGMMPALAAGNVVIIKPSELTPLTTLRLAELATQAGLPDNVVQVVTGAGTTVGQTLLDHPHIGKVVFTGSTDVGRAVMTSAARHLKRVTLELGGKSANIVFANADLKAAAEAAPMGVFDNAGQDCCSRSRLLVQRSVFDEFIELLVPAVQGVVVGDPTHADTQVGPLISAAHRSRVSTFLADNPQILVQADIPDGSGYWFPPTVVRSDDGRALAATQEIFGPVVTIIPFDDEDDAVRIANDTAYGLAGSIWTRDIGQALRTARRIEVGNLSINSNSAVRYQAPFGGFKQSGVGRELGPEAALDFTETKSVFISTN